MSTKPIGTLGTIETETVNGRAFADPANLITLYAYSGSNSRATFRQMGVNAGSGYSPPFGKEFKCDAARFISVGNATAVAVLQTDNDLGPTSSGAFTNPIYFGTGDSTAQTLTVVTNVVGAPTDLTGTHLGKIAAGKFTSMSNDGSSTFAYLYGYEEYEE